MRHEALVVGGGVAGLTAAVNLADQGFPVVLVERAPVLGGRLRAPMFSWNGDMPAPDVVGPLIDRARNHPLVTVLTDHRVSGSHGTIGNLETTLTGPEGARTVRHGVAILATGLQEWRPVPYGVDDDPRVITLSAFEQRLIGGPWGGGAAPDHVVRGPVGQDAVLLQPHVLRAVALRGAGLQARPP
jgi:heterodisulfide reductase subunit A